MTFQADTIQTLMNSAYDRWSRHEKDWNYLDFLDNLPVDERDAVVFGNWNYQVENGGVSQWIINGYCLALHELREVLADFIEWATHEPGLTEAVEAARMVVWWLDQLEEYIDFSQPDRGCMGDYLERRDDGGEPWEEVETLINGWSDEYYKAQQVLLAGLERWFRYRQSAAVGDE